MTREQQARELFSNSYNCAQAVATAFSRDTGIDEDTSCRMATAFGAGGGRRQFCCGAVAGALLVISLLKGRSLSDNKNIQEETYALTRAFFTKFEAMFGSIECRILLDGLDLHTTAGQQRFTQEQWALRCEEFVAGAVKIVEELLGRENKS